MRLIIFDCDGTLVDSQHVIVECMRTAFQACGLMPPLPDAVKRIVGLGLVEAIHRLYPEGDAGRITDLVESYKECFIELRAKADLNEPLFANVLEILTYLMEQNYILGIATGKSRRGLLATLETHGLRKYFTTLQTIDDAPSKPHPAMLEQAMAETGADKNETIFVGDTVFDIEMAINAGTGAFGVSWGYHETAELHAAGAHRVIDKMSELPTLIVQWPEKN